MHQNRLQTGWFYPLGGARRALPKRPVCRYHNTREVATHEIRNTVTQGKGIDRQERRIRGKFSVSVMPGVCLPMTATGLRSSLPFRDGEGGHLYV